MTTTQPPYNILLIENDDATRELLNIVFGIVAGRRYQIGAMAATAGAALEYLTTHPLPDAIIVDHKLDGEMSGAELVKHLREHPSYRNIPIVAHTAYPNQFAAFPEGQGVDVLIVKPSRNLPKLLAGALSQAMVQRGMSNVDDGLSGLGGGMEPGLS